MKEFLVGFDLVVQLVETLANGLVGVDFDVGGHTFSVSIFDSLELFSLGLEDIFDVVGRVKVAHDLVLLPSLLVVRSSLYDVFPEFGVVAFRGPFTQLFSLPSMFIADHQEIVFGDTDDLHIGLGFVEVFRTMVGADIVLSKVAPRSQFLRWMPLSHQCEPNRYLGFVIASTKP